MAKANENVSSGNNNYIKVDYLKLETVFRLVSVLKEQTDFQEILRLITTCAIELLDTDITLIMLINPTTRETVKTIFREGENDNNDGLQFVRSNISGWVINHNLSFLSNDLKQDTRFRKDLFRKYSVESAMCIPLKSGGIIIGMLIMLNKSGKKQFGQDDLSFFETFADIVSPFLWNTQKIQDYFVSSMDVNSLLNKYRSVGLIGKSKAFIELLKAIEAAIHCDVRILLEGQSGTGKELIARAIHQFGSRSGYKYIPIDCGAIPSNLIESELFGHVKGAFTGAATERKGLLQEANHGTLFIDEISSLPLDLQARFLRVLQEGELRPVGGNKTIKIDVRIISASSIPLHTMVEKQQFREDLFYRLLVYPIHVPSLSERKDDIPLLANSFLKIFAKQQKKQAELFHEEVLEWLKGRSWPGNIRELENFVERMVTLVSNHAKKIVSGMLPTEFRKEFKKTLKRTESDIASEPKSLEQSLSEYEGKLIQDALIRNNWNQSKTARALNVSEQTVRYKMKKYGIKRVES